MRASHPWFQIRDLYLGMNHKMRNFRKALKMARSSQHPMAKWLSEIIPKRQNWCGHLIALGNRAPHDAEAAAFVGIMSQDRTHLLIAAEKGSVLAKANLLSKGVSGADSWIIDCIGSGDPYALYVAAIWYANKGETIETLSLLKRSAELGYIDAQIRFARYGYETFDSRKLVWYSGDAFQWAKDDIMMMIRRFPNVPNHYVYHFGAFLKKHNYGDLRFITLYNQSKLGCTNAVQMWLLCARRLGVVKDIRKLIGRIIWKFPWKWMAKDDYLEQRRLEDYFPKLKKIKT